MTNAFWMFVAGIFLIPAPLFCSTPEMTVVSDRISTSILEVISHAPWASDARRYDEMPVPQRYRRMKEDFAFDSWVARKARQEGLELQKNEKDIIARRTRELEYTAAVKRLASRLNFTDQEIDQHLSEWTSPLPERWELFYIFIDNTEASTQEEQDALFKRTVWLKEQLTPNNFKDLARLWSDAPSSVEGGALGALNLETLGPTFVSHVKQTPVGSIGGPYPTRSGWNIVYVRSHTPPHERNIPREKLREMTLEVKAEKQVFFASQSDADWTALKKSLGMDKDTTITVEITLLENVILAGKYVQEKAFAASPSEEQLRDIFREKSQSFVHPPLRKAREILLCSPDWSMATTRDAWLKRREVRNRARVLRERIMKGEDFSILARQYSTSETAQKGGDLGWIQEPSSFLIDANLAVLQPGEVSPPIATNKGYLLLQLVDVKQNEPMSFDNARKRCEEIWRSRRIRQVSEDLLREFMKEKTSGK
jgi:parvulin-like peptidyl-prolyl isomerase